MVIFFVLLRDLVEVEALKLVSKLLFQWILFRDWFFQVFYTCSFVFTLPFLFFLISIYFPSHSLLLLPSLFTLFFSLSFISLSLFLPFKLTLPLLPCFEDVFPLFFCFLSLTLCSYWCIASLLQSKLCSFFLSSSYFKFPLLCCLPGSSSFCTY